MIINAWQGPGISVFDKNGFEKPRMDFRFPCPECGYDYITVPYPQGYYYGNWCYRGMPCPGVWACKKCHTGFEFPYSILGDYEFCVYGEY